VEPPGVAILQLPAQQRPLAVYEVAHDLASDAAVAPLALAQQQVAVPPIDGHDVDLRLAIPVRADDLGAEGELARRAPLNDPLPRQLLERRADDEAAQVLTNAGQDALVVEGQRLQMPLAGPG
jgi:hypothetical protein